MEDVFISLFDPCSFETFRHPSLFHPGLYLKHTSICYSESVEIILENTQKQILASLVIDSEAKTSTDKSYQDLGFAKGKC